MVVYIKLQEKIEKNSQRYLAINHLDNAILWKNTTFKRATNYLLPQTVTPHQAQNIFFVWKLIENQNIFNFCTLRFIRFFYSITSLFHTLTAFTEKKTLYVRASEYPTCSYYRALINN